MAKSVEEAMGSMWQNLEEKTGKSRADWIAVGRNSGLNKHRELINWLKAEHGITHGYANAVALASLAKEEDTALEAEDQIAGQYAGPKAALIPVYEALSTIINGFGDDVEFSPKKSYVSLRRSKQFGILQPTTAARLDVGLVLKGVPPEGRLEASGSFNTMLTHRVRVSNIEEVNAELTNWLQRAYDEA